VASSCATPTRCSSTTWRQTSRSCRSSCPTPGVLWADAAISIATHKANVYIDLSGWLPKYFPPQLVRQANTLLKHKVLFGSDFPVLTPDRWMGSFAELSIRDDALLLIMKENAVRLLGLG
jgi:predicted TIM-barrel fold metal-dependent hydrolase